MSSTKKHIYYGAIDAADIPMAEIPTPSDDNNQTQVSSYTSNESTEPLTTSIQQHQQLLAAYEVQKAARSVIVPSLDQDVKMRLREFGEPICLFAEGPYERRERLKLVMARQSIKSLGPPREVAIHVDSSSVDQQRRLFFSQGGGALLEARKAIARFSLPRAVKRLKHDKQEFDTMDPIEIDHRVGVFNRSLKHKIEVLVSQVGSERPMSCVRFAPESCFLATASWSPTICVWKIPQNKEIMKGFHGHKERVNYVSWNPNFTSSAKQTMSWEKIKEAECSLAIEDTESENDITFSSDWHFASASIDSKVGIWSLKSDQPLRMLEGHEDRVNRVESHPSGKYLASSSHDETWRLWDIEYGTELLLQEGHSSGVYGLKFHPDGSIIFTGDLGGIIRAWDLRTGRTIFPLTGHVKQVLGMSINPWRVNQLATCSDDNTIRIWDIRKQRCIDFILAHDRLISDVVYEVNHGRYLMSTSFDQTLKLWSSTEFSCSAILHEHEARVSSGDISPDGQCIVSASFDRTFKLWTFTRKLEDDDILGKF